MEEAGGGALGRAEPRERHNLDGKAWEEGLWGG